MSIDPSLNPLSAASRLVKVEMGDRPIFVVQKHQARTLHYDFRLEIEGLLKSWVIPKGPSVDPSIRRLAIMVDDHDLNFASFEGMIPSGQYGAGKIIVWDRGWWETALGPDNRIAMKSGKLDFTLHGKKLQGRWVLSERKAKEGGWFLIKMADQFAVKGTDILTLHPKSVISGLEIGDLIL